MANRGAPVLVWDRETEVPETAGDALHWRSYAVGPRLSSIPVYLETHAERLRSKYLAFIHDLGESLIAGKSVAEHLALEDGFSFWWMTRLAEKSPFKSPGIYSALRLLALEELLLERKPAWLELDTADDGLAEAIGELCGNLEIGFVRRPGSRSSPARRGLWPPLRGALSFVKFLVSRWTLRRVERPRWFSGDAAVFICSFFAHLDVSSCARGEFRSRYWETLPKNIHQEGRRVNWLHHYLHGYSSDAPDARTSEDWLRRFNADAGRQGAHAFLESYLSPSVALRAARRWLGLNAAAVRLRGISAAFAPKGSAVRLWPVLREDWRTSLGGTVGAVNCLWVELFDAALKDVPRQKTGLYLFENQAWEMAFLRAWRRHGHGEIVGAAHATVPFWHLYHFDDPREFESASRPRRPAPDRVAVNGPAARRIMAGTGFPAERLVDVEALRYLALPRLPASGFAQTRVIILGDVIEESMRSLLSNLEGSLRALPPGFRFTLKPHPLYPVDLSAYPGLRAERTTEGLERILGEFDVAVAANGTSAAIDAHQAGLPVIVGLSGAELNLSPLRGEPGARFAGTPEEMSAALREAAGAARAKTGRDEFFYLDPELPRWRRLLKMGGIN
jgi:surface carbohydrate biosynthesis protein (TIGR04326 family)